MLNKTWTDSMGTADNPEILPLPADDSVAMRRITHNLHNKRDLDTVDLQDAVVLSSWQVDRIVQQLLKLAELAHKIDCVAALESMVIAILARLQTLTSRDTITLQSLNRLAAVAYICKEHRHFAILTKRMDIEYYDKPYLGLLQLNYSAHLPDALIPSIAAQRRAAHEEITSRFLWLVKSSQRCRVSSCHAEISAGNLRTLMTQKLEPHIRSWFDWSFHSIWPGLDFAPARSLREMLLYIIELGELGDLQVEIHCTQGHPHIFELKREVLDTVYQDVLRIARGICLEHVKDDCKCLAKLRKWSREDPIAQSECSDLKDAKTVWARDVQ